MIQVSPKPHISLPDRKCKEALYADEDIYLIQELTGALTLRLGKQYRHNEQEFGVTFTLQGGQKRRFIDRHRLDLSVNTFRRRCGRPNKTMI
jgi:hypothetical protein